jgi:preprotein translocase subunit SecD
MNIKEFSKPLSSKKLNESLAAKFGTKINVDRFTTEQLLDARNKLRTQLSQVETTESYDTVQKETYQKNKLFLDVLNAAVSERDDHIVDAIEEAIRKPVKEGAEDEAEIVMAAKDMVDRVTGWMEDTAEMQSESMLELADAIRDEMGSEKAEQFTTSIKTTLEQLYTTMETTRSTLTQGVGMLTGEGDMQEPMGADDEMGDMEMEPTDDMDMDMDTDMDMDADDDFGADAAAAGGEEEMGREKRESVKRSKKKLA